MTLGFSMRVEGSVEASVVGREFCRLISDLPQIGNPDWIATPTDIAFISATDVEG